MSSNIEDGLDTKTMDTVIKKYGGLPGSLLGILEELQNHHPNKYLPKSVLAYVSEKMSIPIARVYSVATFYSFFNLKPQGEHCITVCRGTACHTKGSRMLLNGVQDILKLKENPEEDNEKFFLTSEDRKFTIRTVACFGQCALAPVVEVDGIIYSNVKLEQLRQLILKIKAEDK